MKEKTYIIAPVCSDLNRGDQALVWESKVLAETAGYKGKYFCVSASAFEQTKKNMNMLPIIPVLEHPSRKYKNNDNIKGGISLKIKWGIVAVFDFLTKALLLNKFTRAFGTCFLSKEQQKTLQTFKNADAVFVKGGGFVHAYGGITAPYYIFFILYHINLALSLKKDVYILPNSFGPFDGLLVKKMVKKTLAKCKCVFARESVSQDMLRNELNINAQLFPDLAFYLKSSCKKTADLKTKYNLDVNIPLVAVTLRPYRFPGTDNPKQKYVEYKNEMVKFLKMLFEKGYMPVIVEHTLAVNDHEKDICCINDVCSQLNEKEYIIVSDDNFTCRDLKAIYELCDYVVGTRFHSVIFSLSANIPGIAITYGGNKGQGIMKDIGVQEYAIPIEEVSATKLIQVFDGLVLAESEIVKKISDYNAKKKNEYQHMIDVIKEKEV